MACPSQKKSLQVSFRQVTCFGCLGLCWLLPSTNVFKKHFFKTKKKKGVFAGDGPHFAKMHRIF